MNKLYPSQKNNKIARVIPGLPEYFNSHASLLTLITLILPIITTLFPLFLIYIISIFIVPSQTDIKSH
ncbi:PspC domain-containing protein, partial [Bacillus subtilis]|uniref:PspC domain-containing protein n=1 Tax=Bacillus subtilis TaxID=1423 RepID=UPI0011A20D1D